MGVRTPGARVTKNVPCGKSLRQEDYPKVWHTQKQGLSKRIWYAKAPEVLKEPRDPKVCKVESPSWSSLGKGTERHLPSTDTHSEDRNNIL